MTPLLNGQAMNVRVTSNKVTLIRGSIRLRKRAQVVPAKPPPTTTTLPPAPWAMAGSGSNEAEAPAAATLRKSRRVGCALVIMVRLLPQSFCAPYHSAIALISLSEKPLAIFPITVDAVCPDLNACIAAVMSAGLRPMSLGTLVSTRPDGWQPEQDVAPGGASASPAAEAEPANAKIKAAANTAGMGLMS